MKTSVALCTYNGEKFLQEQLDSILNQTLPVDEIVVCDDGSTDSTIEILESYSNKNPEIFRIFRNEVNLRSVKNFEKAISLCSNEIIFLCDQDDLWIENKVEKIVKTFQENPEIEVIATNGFGMDENGKKLDVITIWDVPSIVRENNFQFNYFNILNLVGNFATGATMALKKEIVKQILPFPQIDGFHHDEWIALVSAKDNRFFFLDEKLISYREHSTQQVGGVFYENTLKERKSLTNFFSIDKHEKNFTEYKRFVKRLASAYEKNISLLEKVNQNKEFFRANLLQIEKKYHENRAAMKKKYPIRYFLINLIDQFTNKRQLKTYVSK